MKYVLAIVLSLIAPSIAFGQFGCFPSHQAPGHCAPIHCAPVHWHNVHHCIPSRPVCAPFYNGCNVVSVRQCCGCPTPICGTGNFGCGVAYGGYGGGYGGIEMPTYGTALGPFAGEYRIDKHPNNSVTIRAIERFIQETISSYNGSYKFDVGPIQPVSEGIKTQFVGSYRYVSDRGEQSNVLTIDVLVRDNGSFSFNVQGASQNLNLRLKELAERLSNIDLSKKSKPQQPDLVWTNVEGVKIKGRIIDRDGSFVTFNKSSNKKQYRVKISKFCEADQKLINEKFPNVLLTATSN